VGLDDEFKDCINESDLWSEGKNFITYRMKVCCARIATLARYTPALDDKSEKIIKLKFRQLRSRISSTQDTIADDRSATDSGLLKSVYRELDDYRGSLRELENELDMPEDHELFRLLKDDTDALRFDYQQQFDELSQHLQLHPKECT
jgi:hypothetical protein